MLRTAERSEKRFRQSNRSISSGFSRVNTAAGKFSSGGGRNFLQQLNQIGQQGAVTGNYLQALAIQIPDMAAGFGGLALAMGAAVGFLTPFALGLLDAGDAAEEMVDALSLEQVRSGLAQLDDLVKSYTKTLATSAAIGVSATQVRLQMIAKEYEARLALLELERLALEDRKRQIAELLQANRAALQEAVDARVLDGQDPDADVAGFVRTRFQSESLEATQKELEQNSEITREIKRQKAELSLVELSLETINQHLDEGAGSIAEMANRDLTKVLAEAADRAKVLAAQFGVALGIAQQLGGGGVSGPDAARREFYPTQPIATYRFDTSPKSGGGGQSKHNDELREAARLYDATRTSAERYADQIGRLNELLEGKLISPETHSRAVAALDSQLTVMGQTAQSAASAIRTAFDGVFDDPARALETLGKELLQLLLYAQLAQKLPGLFGIGGALPLFSGRASGGPVAARQPYIVGERGPEIFVPGTSGAVVPNHQMTAAPQNLVSPVQRIVAAVPARSEPAPQDVVINNYAPANVSARHETGPDGRELLMIEIDSQMARGRFDASQGARYGNSPKAMKRG